MIKQTLLSRVLFLYTQWTARAVLFVLLLSGLFILGVSGPQQATAAPNNNLNFQARLQNGAGAIVPDGYYNVTFRMYDAVTAGNMLWDEVYSGGNRVRVANGYLSVSLGSLDPFPGGLDWSEQYYLTMDVGGTSTTPSWDGEMAPRLKLTSVPYAFRAGFSDNATNLQAAGTHQSTLSWDTQTAARSILLPNASGILCLQGSDDCGFATGSAADYIQNSTDSQTANFNITGNGTIGGTLNVTSATTLGGTLTVSNLATINGLLNTGATVNAALTLGNFISDATIGTAAETVDTYTTILIPQTNGGRVLELPSPTVATAGRIIYILNTGAVDFTMHGSAITPGSSQNYVWNGSAWAPSGGAPAGVSSIGPIDSVTKSANGAVISGNSLILQTADGTNPGLVSTGTQTFAGDKTFIDNVSIAGTASLDSTLLVAGATTLSSTLAVAGDVTIGSSASTETFTKLDNPDTIPTGVGRGTAFSADGQYMSVAHSTTPFVTFYKRSGDTFTKLDNPSTLPTGQGTGVAWSANGQYVSVAHNNAPFITIYKRSGDTFTKLDNPSTLPTAIATGVAFSADGQYLSVSHAGAPFITIYKRSGDTFTKLADPADLPTNHGRSTAFSPDGQYLSIGHDTLPYITIYKRSGDTFTKLDNPSTLPTGQGTGTAFSPDGQYLSVAHAGAPNITIYKRSGDTFTKLDNPSTLPTGQGNGTAFSPDGQYLSVVHIGGTLVTIYKRSGDTFTKLDNPDVLPNGIGQGTAFSPDGQYLSVAHEGTTPRVTIYKRGYTDTALYGGLTVAGSVTASSITANSGIFAQLSLSSGDGSGGVVLSAQGLRLSGSARNTKQVVLTPEYAGAVLDGTGSGTMTAGYDATARKNYYNWTSSAGTSQTYSVVITAALPSDWSGWTPTGSVCIETWRSTANGTGSGILIAPNGTTDLNAGSISPSSNNTWTTTCAPLTDSYYVAGGIVTVRLNMSAHSDANFRLGNITMTYLSAF